jgi:DNA-binding transcriptional LysR family regulator
MNFKQIRGYIELSKTLNFSRTAESMYMSQPAFSRMIEKMEKDLGVKLIQRDKVHPKLTPAGQRVLVHCQRLLEEFDDMMEEVRGFREEHNLLRIGILEDGIRATNTGRMIREFATENPKIDIDFINTSESQAYDQIAAGELDCAVLVHFPDIYRDKLMGTVIYWDRDSVFMKKDNPLASSKDLHVKELKAENFIVVGEKQSRFGFNRTMSLCMQYGFQPHIARNTSSVNTALLDVDMGYGVMILHTSMIELAGENTVAIPLLEEPVVPIRCIQRKDSGNPAMEKFRQFISERVEQESAGE